MKILRANCRIQFTAADVEFIAETLSEGNSANIDAIAKLLADESVRDSILDSPALRDALSDQVSSLKISQRLFFYIHVRHELKQVGIEDATVADYVAEVLTRFSEAEQWRPIAGCEDSQSVYLFEIIAKMPVADEFERFILNAHIGNYILTLLGLFNDHIRYREEYKAAPTPRFYEGMGAHGFQKARDHRMAQRLDLEDVYDVLSNGFQSARQELNQLAEKTLFVGNDLVSSPRGTA